MALKIATSPYLEGAKREAREELGIDTDLIEPIYTFTDDHGPWRYDTIIALVSPDLSGSRDER